jgi:hypothetical protein
MSTEEDAKLPRRKSAVMARTSAQGRKAAADRLLAEAQKTAAELVRPEAIRGAKEFIEAAINSPDGERRIFEEFPVKILGATVLKALIGDSSAARLFFQQYALWQEAQQKRINVKPEPNVECTPAGFTWRRAPDDNGETDPDSAL